MKLVKIGLLAAVIASSVSFIGTPKADAQIYVRTPGYAMNDDFRAHRWFRHHEMRRLYDNQFDNDNWRFRRWHADRGWHRGWY